MKCKRIIILTILVLTILSLFVSAVYADVWVNGYTRKNGTHVQGYWRSSPDSDPTNNFSYPGNVNPYTGKVAPGNPETYLKDYPNYSNKPNVVPVPIPQIPTNEYVIEKQILSAEYIKVIKENVNIYEEPDNSLAIVGIASEGDVFKCVEVGESFSKIILFSGKARYINSLYIIKVDYSVKVPDRAICREVSTLIEDVMKNTNLEIENNYLKENIKKEYSYNEYCNFLIDRNLLEIFQSRDINPADYSQIIINAVK